MISILLAGIIGGAIKGLFIAGALFILVIILILYLLFRNKG
jgi:hypothetical protein